VFSRSGTWIVLHGTSLVASGSRRAAVIVEPAHPARITPLLMSAYGSPSVSRNVRSRRDLVRKVFFAHYEPRFRDNENRALEGDPLRGEPVPERPDGRG
jgi:hypothetical protein